MTVAVKSLMMEGADHAMSVYYSSHVQRSGVRFTIAVIPNFGHTHQQAI
jgi:hypothetical protein